MKKYVLSIDQGTTSTRAILFDAKANLIAIEQKKFTQYFPFPSWVEHDAMEILESTLEVVNGVIKNNNIDPNDIDSIGITNQRETAVVWDKKTGKPVYNAIVWQSRQSQEITDNLIAQGYERLIHSKTGLLINPYFSASKIRWILDHIENGQERANNGELLCGTIDTWLVYNLTNHKVHATDVTNASRTLLYNIKELRWDEELLKLFNIPRCMLPEVKESSDNYGYAEALDLNGHLVPINGVIGDQQSSLFGQCCFHKGSAKNTYGTGCFMLLNTGDKPVFSKNGLLTTIAWKLDGKVSYALEGSVFIGGSVVQWLREGVKLINCNQDCEKYAKKLKDNDGVYFVPAFVGLGTPYWDNDARGAIFGLTRGTTRAHIARAALEAIAFQNKDVMNVMTKESKLKVKALSCDGGATNNCFLMQFQADILNFKIVLPKHNETTALGAAYMAGLRSGFYDIDTLIKHKEMKKLYNPSLEKDKVNVLYKNWKKAVKATRVFE